MELDDASLCQSERGCGKFGLPQPRCYSADNSLNACWPIFRLDLIGFWFNRLKSVIFTNPTVLLLSVKAIYFVITK